MRTEIQIAALKAACDSLNAYAKRKNSDHAVRKGRPWKVKPEDLVTLDEAREMMNGEKALEEWDGRSVFVPTDIAVRLYDSMTPKARGKFLLDEVLGGWFEEQEAEVDDEGRCVNADEVGCDGEGEFCSTPCHGEDAPSVEDYSDDIESCARGGLLFIYSDKY